MKVLGIESSCDETAAAVLSAGPRILSSSVASQLDVHSKYGGVVPELASREHLRAIVPVVREALDAAGLRLEELDGIAATRGPGLMGSLLVGLTYAKSLAYAAGLPLVGVHHLEGHIEAALLDTGERLYPLLALVASGGHTHLFACLAEGEYRLVGQTRDDAAGEAYDKVAKLLGFGYPGGPVIDQLSVHGDPHAVRFTAPRLKDSETDFSFSGLKTAVLRWFEASTTAAEVAARKELLKRTPRPTVEEWLTVTSPATLGVLASFQHTVVEDLLRRAEKAAAQVGARALVVSGGVSANRGLRRAVAERDLGLPVHFPEPKWSTDNGVMIALAGQRRLERGQRDGFELRALANWSLSG
ncbi:MAG: tRNA (adenosine(37)-N6)-threonylcarbamoyltransferase complex transferase subunit TsaD [Bryobacter sp.]|nr:tRNA (adenosine(37)-N6)-threonylcarbamoyltransferase complex transferase subunit TsaD [Bryobacter sp.]